jgi:hypothetical protein
VFKEVMLRAYSEKLLGPVTRFPAEMEQHISTFLEGSAEAATVAIAEVVAPAAKPLYFSNPWSFPSAGEGLSGVQFRTDAALAGVLR